jgi:D-alanyl-lipoteichoic acid acyltransferase DltB (MBOAT superfamily)
MQRQKGWRSLAIAIAVIGVDIAILIYFKYLSFLVEDVVGLILPGLSGPWIENTVSFGPYGIPPGISFYTFQMVAFVVDSYKLTTAKPIRFVDYVNFASFFPQVVAGPIERRSDLLPQIESFRLQFSIQNIDEGLKWLAIGLFMKLVLGDNLAPHINLDEFTNPWTIWFSTYLFGLRIYFDFAGYSFIALGIARIIGIHLSVNFLAPYISLSIQEFWRRWHVTLSTWFRDYLFIPLGGSRVPWAALNIFTVFVISGLWHGAGWNFILWGAYHGGLLVMHKYLGKRFEIPPFFAWALTFSCAMFGWLFFMETRLSYLLLKLRTLVIPSAYSLANLHTMLTSMDNRVGLGLIFLLAHSLLALEHIAARRDRGQVYDRLLHPTTALTLGGLVILLAARSSSQFVYFAF